jgi:hypothetical protein
VVNVTAPPAVRRNEALQVFKDCPEKISYEMREKIIAHQVVLGMTPHEACLAAGGRFAFKVLADKSKWKDNSNPFIVMWTQSINPDNSEIWMTFTTDTQYPGEGLIHFMVYFQGGKALKISKL